MTKPIIFFGHSSTDKDMIIPIKEHILDRTGNAVSIFLSSDGASIPFKGLQINVCMGYA